MMHPGLPFLHHKELFGYVLPLSDITRPEFAFATSLLSRFTESTPAINWNAAKYDLKYITRTRNYCNSFSKATSRREILDGSTDFEFAADRRESDLVSTFVFLYAGGACFWGRKNRTLYHSLQLTQKTSKFLSWSGKLSCCENIFGAINSSK